MSGTPVGMNRGCNTVQSWCHIPSGNDHYALYLSGFSFELVVILYLLQ